MQKDSRLTHRTLSTAAAVVAVIYLAAMTAFLVTHGSWPTPDFLIPPLLLIAVFSGRGWRFLIDWAPFLLLVLFYEGSRGVADNLGRAVNYRPLIEADKWLLNSSETAPTILQNRFFREDRVAWYDWVASVFHMAHFVTPTAFGFVLWIHDRTKYWRFAITTIVMFFAGSIGYVVYPAAPPWMAADLGLIPPINRILVHTLSHLPTTRGLVLVYRDFSPNEVAAMPSLHAATPLLIAFIAANLWGKKGLIAFPYAVLAGLAFMYLGEHYLVDILMGWVFAVGAFLAIWLPLPWLAARLHVQSWGIARKASDFKSWPAWPLAIGASAFMVFVWLHPLFVSP